MPLDIPSPPEHPFSFYLHEKDFTLLNHMLSRLEPALDKLADLNTSLALLRNQTDAMERLISGLTERLTKMEISHADASGGNRWTERIIWALVSLAIGGLLGTKL